MPFLDIYFYKKIQVKAFEDNWFFYQIRRLDFFSGIFSVWGAFANTWKIFRKFNQKNRLPPSTFITNKLRIKVGCKIAISKTKTDKMYIIRINHNVPTEVKGAVWPKSYMTCFSDITLVKMRKGEGMKSTCLIWAYMFYEWPLILLEIFAVPVTKTLF